MDKNTITNLMIAHHSLLDALFFVLKDKISKSDREESLEEFSWEMKKHFFTENEAIFKVLPAENHQISAMISHLMQEHVFMLDDLKNMESKGKDITAKELESFFEIMKNHREQEEKELYPRLDEQLDDSLKTKIINKINQIPLTAKT